MPNSLDQLLLAATQWPDERKDQFASGVPWLDLIDALLEDSLRSQASQIHIQSMRRGSFIRYRINGQMVNRAEIEHRLHENLAIALKRFLRMDVLERRRPQYSSLVEISLNGSPQYIMVKPRVYQPPNYLP